MWPKNEQHLILSNINQIFLKVTSFCYPFVGLIASNSHLQVALDKNNC